MNKIPAATTELNGRFRRCAGLLAQADGLLVTAGAGIGVDSALPDFRGKGGFWGVYPALGRAGLRFEDVANPAAFAGAPELAWGFYGHRLALYRATAPNRAFHILHAIAQRLPEGAFVFTSNVDGHFQKAGFDPLQVCECHGSIHHLQCLAPCSNAIWPADDFVPQVDTAACRLVGTFPKCPRCAGLARPNILMFDDWQWIEERTRRQRARLDAWRAKVERLLVIEIGAGTAIPTVRRFGEALDAPIIRINPADAATSLERGVALPLSALAAMQGIENALLESGFFAAPPSES